MAGFGTRQADLPLRAYTEGLIVLDSGRARRASTSAAAGERLSPVNEAASTPSQSGTLPRARAGAAEDGVRPYSAV